MTYRDKQFIYNPLSENIDTQWAGRAMDGDLRFNNYYDYYFSGEDIKVYIDGLFGPNDELDIASFAYSVKQEKQPLYGFWSYNYDAVMLGTRLITGEFTIFTRYPRRMTELLERAAKARQTEKDARKPENSIVSRMTPQMGSNDDRINLAKYWANTQLDRVTIDPGITENFNGQSPTSHIFSAHPPFNFIVLYGVEETALSPLSAPKDETYSIENDMDRMIYSDVNQRSIKLGNDVSPMKIVLQQIDLLSMATSYSPGGQPVAESYQFMARDYYFSETDLGFIKQLPTFVQPSTPAPDAAPNYNDNTSVGGTI
jgi:hypothetical protein